MTKNKKLRLSLFLFLLGLIGVLSLLTLELTGIVPEDRMYLIEGTSEILIKLTLVITHATFLIFGILMGIFTYDKTQLQLPFIEGLVFRKKNEALFLRHLLYGIFVGIISACIILIVSSLFEPFLEDFIKKSNDYYVPLQVRLLSGGITEEITMRFGVMSLIIFILIKITKKTSPTIYIFGILISAFLFAISHFPGLYTVEAEPSIALLMFITIGNMTAGIFFGWLYWKKSLTAAMIAHMFFHITVVCLSPFITS